MKVLILVNEKKHSDQAMKFFGRLFGHLDPSVTLLYIYDKEQEKVSKDIAQMCLQQAKRILKKFDIAAKTKLRVGELVEKAVQETRQGRYDLVVLGTPRIAQELEPIAPVALSEQAERLVMQLPASLLLVRNPSRKLERILVTTDGSGSSDKTLAFLASTWSDHRPFVTILNVIPELYSLYKDVLDEVAQEQLLKPDMLPEKRTRYLYQAKDVLAKAGIRDTKIILREGNASREIVRESYRGYDLIMMGLTGRKGKKKSTIGRHAFNVMRHVHTSVLMFKSKPRRRKGL